MLVDVWDHVSDAVCGRCECLLESLYRLHIFPFNKICTSSFVFGDLSDLFSKQYRDLFQSLKPYLRWEMTGSGQRWA